MQASFPGRSSMADHPATLYYATPCLKRVDPRDGFKDYEVKNVTHSVLFQFTTRMFSCMHGVWLTTYTITTSTITDWYKHQFYNHQCRVTTKLHLPFVITCFEAM